MPTKCPNCGAQIPDKAAFCPGCGAPKAAARRRKVAQPAKQPAGPGIGETVEKLSSLQMISIGIFIGVLLAGIGKLISLFFGLGIILTIIGLNGAGLAMLFGGLFNKNLNPTLRGGLATAGGIMLSVANLTTATTLNIGF